MGEIEARIKGVMSYLGGLSPADFAGAAERRKEPDGNN